MIAPPQGAPADETTQVGDPVRVLTWNLWWRFGDWRSRHKAILSVLSHARPDICGLQEVWASPVGNAAELLARELGMHWTWTASPAPGRWQEQLDEPSIGIGNAILSRWPIGAHAHLRLPTGSAGDEGRTVLHAIIDAPAGPVPFFTTQLNSAPQHSAVRCEQVVAIAGFVAGNTASKGHPPVVTGDFNAEPDSDEMRLLGGHKTAPSVPGLVLVDAWRYRDPPSAGWTWNRRNPHVMASREPSARIDYIWVGLPRAGTRGSVRAARLVGDYPVEGVWASDHAGVLAELDASSDPAVAHPVSGPRGR